MGWLDEQIKQRKNNDNKAFDQCFKNMAEAVTGKADKYQTYVDGDHAFVSILKYFHVNTQITIPSIYKTETERFDYCCSKSGLVYRDVKLTTGWYKNAHGPMIGFTNDEKYQPIALIPCVGGYKFLKNGRYVRVNKRNENDFYLIAISFYKSYPNRKITPKDLIKYSFSAVPVRNWVVLGILYILTTAIGLITPKISYFLYGPVIDDGKISLLIGTVILYICVTISVCLFNTFKSMYNAVIKNKMDLAVSAATMNRVLSLPAPFFRKYSAGELGSRTGHLNSLSSTLVSLFVETGFSSLLSLAYIGSIFEYAPGLVLPALLVILATVVSTVLITLAEVKISKRKMEITAKESGLSFSIVRGISKIRLAGAEKRIFAKWANQYSESAALNYNPPAFIKFREVINLFITSIGTVIMYFYAMKTGVGVAEYYAFTTAYGVVFAAFSSIGSIAASIANIKPTLEMASPIMNEVPETKENKEMVNKLNGNIEISNISFRYNDTMPFVLNNVSLKIKSGQYVAIVGKTGCGKSTLIRLLLGFEKAQKGSIYFDGKDINTLDLKSLRRKIGTVMQDGKLFQGDIFSNIAVCAPELTQAGAFEAADIAGIGDDIREMPMGMATLISDGGGGVSGGQRQRILIARAVAAKPSVLIFDEATSALDNITQKRVSESLDGLNCTRIVIAHRLCTIKHCDRIIYLEEGKILEDGTFDDLIALNGKFADLVKRQMLDD